MARMVVRTPEAIEAEIEALKARIRRLRLERKMADLAEAESRLLSLAEQGSQATDDSANTSDPAGGDA